MTNTAFAILGLAAWYVAILLALASYRVYTTVARSKPANSFAPDGSDLPAAGQRLTRVHANACENVPLFVGVLVYAVASGQTEVTDPTATWLLAARVAQGVVHACSTAVPAVLLRFALFALQIGLLLCWIWQFAA